MLKLRSENFGGLIFNSKNGVKLFLDSGGYLTLENFIRGKQKKFSDQEKNFLSDAINNLGLEKKESYIINSLPANDSTEYPFSVLRAPILVDLQITSQCNLACPHCYALSSPTGRHLSLRDINRVFDNCQKAGVLEVALGGGEPTLHPQLSEILKLAAKKSLICNLATNGKGLDNQLVDLLFKYCGAVALSIEFLDKDFENRRGYSFEKFKKSAKTIKDKKIKLIFQITVSKNNLDKIVELTKFLLQYEPYGIVFLTYKPVGRGKNFDSPLTNLDPQKILNKFKKCFELIKKVGIKAGYDCCLAKLLIGLQTETDVVSCSATRESLAVNMNLDVLPCSFVNNYKLGNLRDSDLLSIWKNRKSYLFRDRFVKKIEEENKCKACQQKFICLGGCPEFNLVNCIF